MLAFILGKKGGMLASWYFILGNDMLKSNRSPTTIALTLKACKWSKFKAVIDVSVFVFD